MVLNIIFKDKLFCNRNKYQIKILLCNVQFNKENKFIDKLYKKKYIYILNNIYNGDNFTFQELIKLTKFVNKEIGSFHNTTNIFYFINDKRRKEFIFQKWKYTKIMNFTLPKNKYIKNILFCSARQVYILDNRNYIICRVFVNYDINNPEKFLTPHFLIEYLDIQ